VQHLNRDETTALVMNVLQVLLVLLTLKSSNEVKAMY